MYDDIIHLAMDQQLLTEIRETQDFKKLPLIKELQKLEDSTLETEEELLRSKKFLTFENIFLEPVGYHLIKEFLRTQHSVDKAIFLSDIQMYKTLNDRLARERVAHKIFNQFCAPEKSQHKKGISVFYHHDKIRDNDAKFDDNDPSVTLRKSVKSVQSAKSVQSVKSGNQSIMDNDLNPSKNNGNNTNNTNNTNESKMDEEFKSESNNLKKPLTQNMDDELRLSLCTENTNIIGVYGRLIKKLEAEVNKGFPPKNVFDKVASDVYNDLRLDVFPRFCKSNHYKMYLKCKNIEMKKVQVKDFHQMRMLGRGAFGMVNACKKRDTGKLYAMKQIDKKRVQAQDSVESIMAERNFLSYMDSEFVTTLKYSFTDEDTLYLILDLMIGGDLKYHLNNEKTFSEKRSKFYAAEVLLGLEHVHSKGIIYRDLKLENILVDSRGHVKISDLGLSVILTDPPGDDEKKVDKKKSEKAKNVSSKYGIRGYAGTPGYTAPEVVLSHFYKHIVDFFSLGVMIYRFLCGKKPFQSKKHRAHGQRKRDDQRRATAELDRNVVEMEPDFPHQYFSPESKSLLKGLLCKDNTKRLGCNGIAEIKQHPWFDAIDFGMLEAGYLDAPYQPSLDEIHAEQQAHIGPPPQNEKFARIKITQEFEKSLEDFPFQLNKVIQDEIVDVLKKWSAERRASNVKEADIFNFSQDSMSKGRNGDSCLGCMLL